MLSIELKISQSLELNNTRYFQYNLDRVVDWSFLSIYKLGDFNFKENT